MKFSLILIAIIAFVNSQQQFDVGNLQVSVQVIQGEAHAEIDIPAPKDFPNWLEDLQMVYSSSGGEDVAGFGWSISGLSKIHRFEIFWQLRRFNIKCRRKLLQSL